MNEFSAAKSYTQTSCYLYFTTIKPIDLKVVFFIKKFKFFKYSV